MPRVKCFNREDALQKAMQAFWARGYDATSVQNLVDCMGINRGSLYDTFGDKHRLFLEALDHYTEASLSRVSPLTQEGNARDLLSKFLYAFMFRNLEDLEKKGCFATNTAVERASHDEDCAVRVREYFAEIEKNIRVVIERGLQEGDITSDRDSKTLAAFFIGVMQGIRVVAKVNPEEACLRPLVEVALASLDG